MDSIMALTEISSGKKVTIRAIRGGYGLVRKLDALGINAGKEIIKVSSQIAHGPVIIRCGNTEMAIGFGMARNIFVELI